MKITQINHGVFMLLMLVTSVVSAQDYPAADFQPKVVYRDESLVKSVPAASPASSVPCEAANTVDKVASKAAEKVEFDPQYPAANFQPKVLFSGSGS